LAGQIACNVNDAARNAVNGNNERWPNANGRWMAGNLKCLGCPHSIASELARSRLRVLLRLIAAGLTPPTPQWSETIIPTAFICYVQQPAQLKSSTQARIGRTLIRYR